jgi:hypothetical protein
LTAAVTRELSIVYGTFTIGGTTDRLIDGKWSYDRGYETAAVECEFVTTAATEAAFATECAAVEAAFATPRARLRVIQGSQTLLDFNPATNSGYNARPLVVKAGDIADTGRSRRYQVRVEVDMPADLSGQNGRRESTVDVSKTASGRRAMRLDGVYTALGSNSAREQYEASIDAYVTTLTTALGGTWELLEESSASADDTDKLLTFARTYQELIFAQSSAATDDAEVFGQRLFITRTKIAPGDADGKNAARLLELSVSYEASIAKTNTKLKAKWDDSVRAYVMSKVEEVAGTGSLAITSEVPRFDYDENRIAVAMTVLAVSSSSVLQASVSTEDDIDAGIIPVPVWSGKGHDKYMLQGAATHIRRITERTRTSGKAAAGGSSGKAGSSADPGSVDLFGIGASTMSGVQSGLAGQLGQFGIGAMGAGSLGQINITYPGGGGSGGGASTAEETHQGEKDSTGFTLLRSTTTVEPLEIGVADYRFTVTDTTTVVVKMYATKPKPGAGAASGGKKLATISQADLKKSMDGT